MSETPDKPIDYGSLPVASPSEERVPNLYAGAPVLLDDDSVLGYVASDQDIRDLSGEQRIVVVTINSEVIGPDPEFDRSAHQARVPVLVERAAGERLLARFEGENPETELNLRIPRMEGSGSFTIDVEGKTQLLLTPEHVEYATQEWERWKELGLDRLPEGLAPDDPVYADDVLVGHIPTPQEIVDASEPSMIRLMTDNPAEVIPVLLDRAAVRSVALAAYSSGRRELNLRVEARSGKQLAARLNRRYIRNPTEQDVHVQTRADVDDLGDAVQKLLDASNNLQQRNAAIGVLNKFTDRRQAEPNWLPGLAELDEIIAALEQPGLVGDSADGRATLDKARLLRELVARQEVISSESTEPLGPFAERGFRTRILNAGRELLASGKVPPGPEREGYRQFIHRLDTEPEWNPSKRDVLAAYEPLTRLTSLGQQRIDQLTALMRELKISMREGPYNEFVIAEATDSLATGCFVCLQGFEGDERDDRADLLWRVSNQGEQRERQRIGQMHSACATRMANMSYPEQWHLLRERVEQERAAGREGTVVGTLQGNVTDLERLQPDDPVYLDNGELLGYMARPGEQEQPDGETLLVPTGLRVRDQELIVRAGPEEAFNWRSRALHRRPDGTSILGADVVRDFEPLIDLEPVPEDIIVTPAGKCDFCSRGRARWVYPASSFSMSGPDEQPYNSQGDWAACTECSKLIERSDYGALTRRSVRDKDPKLRQALSYWQQRLMDQFRSHRTGPRRAAPTPRDDLAEVRQTWFPVLPHKQPQRADFSSAESVCDFCSAQPVLWRYPAMSFDYQAHEANDAALTSPWHSEGDWAACNLCSRAIERRDWPELGKRYMREREETMHELRDKIRPAALRELYDYLKREAQGLFAEFARHRTGERVPVFPDADVRLPTSSPLAQIAFGEQLKLLRWVQSPDGQRYIKAWFAASFESSYGPSRRMTPEQMAGMQAVATVPLRYGETYYWSSEICRMIAGAADVLGSETPWTLLRESVPAPSGFFYCERPVGTSADAPLRVITWTLVHSTSPVVAGVRGYDPDVLISVDPHGRGNPETAKGLALAFYSETPQHQLRPSGFIYWGFGETHVAAATRAESRPEHAEVTRAAVYATMLAFIQQKVIVPSRPFTPDRATRKQAERERPEHEPVLRIIELRRVKRVGYTPPEEHKLIDWKYQWRVRKHWRNQFYPSLGIHQPKWIEGFWKGDPNAPIKPGTHIVIVDR